ncbi:DinB family protein [Edaphocola flava]|uniref:DinB family protein n=1 Tax=Edaphocola flava TaxID=2499629 RepID=UPI00100A760F|nr:DinB family protein [Edaphocola flava]
MDTLQQLRNELEHEYRTTQNFFRIYPEGKNDYAPHEKSMKLGHLATHIAEIFSWPGVMLETNDLDIGAGDRPQILSTPDELLTKMQEHYDKSIAALNKASEEDLNPDWALKYGDNVLASWNKYDAIRHSLNQVTHHRAQLGVYYRLNDIELPKSYGPTADLQSF